MELFAFIIVDIMNWLRGEVTCTASDAICSAKEGSNKAERVWTIQKVDIYPHVHPRALNDCQFYVKYLFEEANTKTINSLSLRKAFYIQMTLPFFFFFWSFYIYFLKIFESWVLFTFIFTSYIWLLSSERAPEIFVFENSYRYRGLRNLSFSWTFACV